MKAQEVPNFLMTRILQGQLLPDESVMEASQNSGWLTVTEAANYLKVKPRTLLSWVRQGKVKGFALSGTKRHVWRFRRKDLDTSFLESPVLPSTPPSVLVKGTQ